MKQIEIAEKIRPFSHRPGEVCLIPGTTLKMQVFPTRIEIDGAVLELRVEGPVEQFTTVLDLEKRGVFVSGLPFRLFFTREGNQLVIVCKRAPEKGLEVVIEGKFVRWKRGERIILKDLEEGEEKLFVEKLSFGNTKKLDWELVCRRLDLKEILPAWFRLSQLIPDREHVHLEKSDAEMKQLFQGGFSGMLCPTGKDERFQGVLEKEYTPAQILHGGAKLIRSLFFIEEDDALYFLPKLPKSFPSGRMTGVRTSFGDQIDFVWSKHTMRTAIIRSNSDRKVTLRLPKEIRSFRLRTSYEEGGEEVRSDKAIDLRKQSVIYLDRFQK